MHERLKEIEELAAEAERIGAIKLMTPTISLRYALDEIKRLTEENERLGDKLKMLERMAEKLGSEQAMRITLKDAEIARLKDALTVAGKRIDSYQD